MQELHTTLGPKQKKDLGIILPHEHIFVDLGPIEEKNYKKAYAQDVIKLMQPELEKARALQVTALVEATPVGVGRRVDIVKAVSEASQFPVVVATGIYREPWVPSWAKEATEQELCQWMLKELNQEIESTGVKAAWIKVSAGDDRMTACEEKILTAAAQAGTQTHAVIGSHSIKGKTVVTQLDCLEKAGYTAERFIWIHTQAEADFAFHEEVAQRGAWLEFDAIGSEAFSDEYFIERLSSLIEAGFEAQILLSHDRGWFDPSKPHGGIPKPFTYLNEQFVPKLKAQGFSEQLISSLLKDNPFNAYAR